MSTAADRSYLTVVADLPPAPLEGVAVEKAAAMAKPRPSWLGVAVNHAKDHHLYLPWAARGYRRAAAQWVDRYHDDWPLMIDTARTELQAADADRQSDLKKLVKKRRAAYRKHRLVWTSLTAAATLPVTAGATVGAITGGLWADLFIGAVTMIYGVRKGYSDEEPRTLASQQQALAEAPADAALDEEELRTALKAAGFTHPITVIQSTPMAADGTRTVTFDLGGATTVTDLRKKTEAIAAALGRDVTMVDITKEGHAGRASLWTASTDPFEMPRPSPLLHQHGPIDAWRQGIPVAYGKRGTPIRLPLTNSNILIGGMTRSGKGVGASNLIVGAAMDPWVNLRIVAGKQNGEWDAYAKAGVAATYFKPSPERLLALLQGLLADKNRREGALGRLGKSKLVPDAIKQLGGVDVLAIDELATYTRPGKPLRDEILEALIELSAVAAGAGILLVLITQYPEVDVLPQALAMNCGTRWAMRVDNATQSNAILGGSAASGGRDASKFDPPRPGLGWLVNPFAGITDLARSFDLDEDERGEISRLLERAADIRRGAGRLAGQWEDPIEKYLLNATGLSSAAGGPKNDGVPGRSVTQLTGEQRLQLDALRGALAAMNKLGRDAATLDEMADIIGGTMTRDRLSELLRAGGAGGADKVKIDGKWTRGYERADVEDAQRFFTGV